MFSFRKSPVMPTPAQALPGRPQAIPTATTHFVLKTPLKDVPAGHEVAIFGMGCFWGAERKFWQMGSGITSTSVGYAGGITPNPTYEETCTGLTGHNEVVRVVYDPKILPYPALLKLFWENHDPTQGMRQGGDTGTQYRSGIYATSAEQKAEALASRDVFAVALAKKGFGAVTTEIIDAPVFYYAEDYHQQYLAKNPAGYCGLGGTGVTCAIGTGVAA